MLGQLMQTVHIRIVSAVEITSDNNDVIAIVLGTMCVKSIDSF